MDDGTIIEWGDGFTMPDGTVKEASIDDIDRANLSNLLTINQNGEVLYALGIPSSERNRKRAIWRLTRQWAPAQESPISDLGSLIGYNELFKDGTTKTTLFFVDSETGEVSDGSTYECDLHPREVFTIEDAQTIEAEQKRQNDLTEADNAVIAAAQLPEVTVEQDAIPADPPILTEENVNSL